MRHLQDFYTTHKDKGLVVLGFNSADKKDIALQFMAENGAKFPTILDGSDAATRVQFQGYRGSGVPLNYIIGRDGRIIVAPGRDAAELQNQRPLGAAPDTQMTASSSPVRGRRRRS